jgi:hypothetical protein
LLLAFELVLCHGGFEVGDNASGGLFEVGEG